MPFVDEKWDILNLSSLLGGGVQATNPFGSNDIAQEQHLQALLAAASPTWDSSLAIRGRQQQVPKAKPKTFLQSLREEIDNWLKL